MKVKFIRTSAMGTLDAYTLSWILRHLLTTDMEKAAALRIPLLDRVITVLLIPRRTNPHQERQSTRNHRLTLHPPICRLLRP